MFHQLTKAQDVLTIPEERRKYMAIYTARMKRKQRIVAMNAARQSFKEGKF
jgi:hypothetical protein